MKKFKQTAEGEQVVLNKAGTEETPANSKEAVGVHQLKIGAIIPSFCRTSLSDHPHCPCLGICAKS